MSMLRRNSSEPLVIIPTIKELTLAVVLPHVVNAFLAASMASLVSSSPISGTVPRSFRFAGSTVYR